ncbi:conserved hypothetical protein [Symbiobacterium thermophilum IAM 14863]|uniref:HPt domain-containing protein n=2 Tax=Symbiobacterium thermophilum TaxID=2734 RepID=Q67LR4_SYMTH|nr:conserved hypothetical protein [Symbiobacterium thermophilum IAM 14863]
MRVVTSAPRQEMLWDERNLSRDQGKGAVLGYMFDSAEFAALREEYLQGARERAGRLREAVAALREGGPVDLRQLRQEVHKLRGSGGFYGFRALSAAAAAAEDALLMVLDGEQERDDHALADLVARVVAEIEAATL